MNRVKTFDSTGVAPGGRLFAADLNSIQDAAAGLTDLTQNIQAGSLAIGEVGLILSRFGAGDAQISGAFRATGIIRATGGLYAGQFTTTARNAIGAGLAPNGLIIFNTTTGQFEWNSGTDGARVWKALGVDTTGDMLFTGNGSSIDFTDQSASNVFLTAKRTADTVARLAIREDGLIEIGPGGSTARDVSLFRSGASVLSLGASVKLILGSGGIQFSTGEIITGTDSITAALIAPNAIGSSELADNAVDTNAIANLAVIEGKIANLAVTEGKIAALAVTDVKIADGAITAVKINPALKPSGGAGAGAEALRALGVAAGTAAAGDDARFASIGTAFPGSPVANQEFILVDSLTAPTFEWKFKYMPSITDAYEWIFIGGAPIEKRHDSGVATGSTSYVDVHANLAVTLSRAGIYIVEFGAQLAGNTSGSHGYLSPYLNTTATDGDAIQGEQNATRFGLSRSLGLITLASAGSVVKLQQRWNGSGGSSVSTANTWMRVIPVRVS